MLQEQQVIIRKLVPNVEGNWLYKDEHNDRIFSQLVYLGKDADPEEWKECTNVEKETYEKLYKIEDVEPLNK